MQKSSDRHANGTVQVASLLCVGLAVGAAGPDAAPVDIGSVQVQAGASADAPAPGSAPAVAPSRPPLTADQPTSLIGPGYIQNNAIATQSYDNLIKFSPSVANVEPTGAGLQQNFQETIRGFRYNQFNSTFDDLVLPGSIGNLAPQTGAYFLAHSIDSISVDRGPGTASQIGYATFGGTVAATLARPSETFGVNPYTTFGSWGTFTQGLRLDSGALADLGGMRAMIDSQHIEGNGYLTGTSTLRNNFYGRIEAPINENTVLTVVGMYNFARTHTPPGATLDLLRRNGANYGLSGDPTSQAYTGYNTDNYYTDFDYIGLKSSFGDGWGIDNKAYTASYYHLGIAGLDPNDGVVNVTPNLRSTQLLANGRYANNNDVPGIINHSDFRAWGDSFRLSKDTDYGQARAGVWFDYNAASSYKYNVDLTAGNVAYVPKGNKTIYNNLYNNTLVTVQPYVEFAWKPLPNLTITPGVKYTNVTRAVNATYYNSKGLPLNQSQTWDALLPSMDVHYEILPGWVGYGQVAEGFLAPPLNTLLVTSANAPASLQPQTTVNYQVGTTYQTDRFAVGFDMYYIRFNNYIARQSNNLGTIYSNNGNAIFKGIEAEGTVKIAGGLSMYGNATVNDANFTGNGFPVAQSPRATGAIGPVFQHDAFYASLLAKYVGSQYLIDGSGPNVHATFPIPSYTDVDLSLGYKLSLPQLNDRSVTARLNVVNLFNDHSLIGYQALTASNAPLLLTNPGRGVFVTLGASL